MLGDGRFADACDRGEVAGAKLLVEYAVDDLGARGVGESREYACKCRVIGIGEQESTAHQYVIRMYTTHFAQGVFAAGCRKNSS